MPIHVTCPSCNTRLKFMDDSAGESVECPKCDAVITVPAPAPAYEVVESPDAPDPPDPPPGEEKSSRRRRPRARVVKRAGMPVWAWFLVGGGVLLFGCCGGGALLLVASRGGRGTESEREYHVGDTFKAGDLQVTIKNAAAGEYTSTTRGGGRLMQHPKALMVVLQIKNTNPNREHEARSQTGRAYARDDVGNEYQSLQPLSDMHLETDVPNHITKGMSVFLRSDRDVSDTIITGNPVPGASKVTVLIDASCYGGRGMIRLVLTREEWGN